MKIRFSAIELLLFVLVLIWGLNFVAMKWALREMQPLAFSAVRYSLAAVLFLAILFARQQRGSGLASIGSTVVLNH